MAAGAGLPGDTNRRVGRSRGIARSYRHQERPIVDQVGAAGGESSGTSQYWERSDAARRPSSGDAAGPASIAQLVRLIEGGRVGPAAARNRVCLRALQEFSQPPRPRRCSRARQAPLILGRHVLPYFANPPASTLVKWTNAAYGSASRRGVLDGRRSGSLAGGVYEAESPDFGCGTTRRLLRNHTTITNGRLTAHPVGSSSLVPSHHKPLAPYSSNRIRHSHADRAERRLYLGRGIERRASATTSNLQGSSCR